MSEEKLNEKSDQIEKELIGGRVYNRTPITEELEYIAQIFQQIAKRYKLTTKPLDTIYQPFEAIKLETIQNTIVRPLLAVKKNKSENSIDWLVDYTNSDENPLAFCIKPMIYREAGISEYWIIDVTNKQIIIYDFKNSGFVQHCYLNPQRIKVGIYKSLDVNYSDIFN